MPADHTSPWNLLQRGRKVTGMSAVLLPLNDNASVDWRAYDRLIGHTIDAGLIPAVNMDTGFAALIDEGTRAHVLQRTHDLLPGGTFVAGAYVSSHPGDSFQLQAYQRQCEHIQRAGGIPIIIQSFGLVEQDDADIVTSYRCIAAECQQFLAFELSTEFAPFGRIYSLEVYRELLATPACVGAKHSSLRRQLEWDRLALRNQLRPDFKVLTGNDLAIDMIMYGSDYLLGLSAFAPDLFAKRDALWTEGNAAFFELNDALQYLGNFAFRPPVPAYRHSAAQFLTLRGWLSCSQTHPASLERPDSDLEVLQDIIQRLGISPPALA